MVLTRTCGHIAHTLDLALRCAASQLIPGVVLCSRPAGWLLCVLPLPYLRLFLSLCCVPWAAWYSTWLLIKLAPKGVVFVFFSIFVLGRLPQCYATYVLTLRSMWSLGSVSCSSYADLRLYVVQCTRSFLGCVSGTVSSAVCSVLCHVSAVSSLIRGCVSGGVSSAVVLYLV